MARSNKLNQIWQFALVTGLALALTACSESKRTPPDDDEGALQVQASQGLKAAGQRESCSNKSELFRVCAEQVLAQSDLSTAEKESLQECDLGQATASDSPADMFAAARAAVQAQCL